VRTRFEVRDRLGRLDPAVDYQEIYRTTATVEFPWDVTRALELALYRTFAIPSIAALLDRTGEFRLRTQKRYDDTALLLAHALEAGLESAEGKAAVSRLNRIHARFEISNDDYLYTLGTFVFVPLRWLDRWGWRPLLAVEREAMFRYYERLGTLMGIRAIPATLAAFEQWFDDYELKHVSYGAPQERTAAATRELFVSWFPGLLAPALRVGVNALLDGPIREAFGFPAPPRWLPVAADLGLRGRARVERLLPPRATPASTQDSVLIKSYPNGHTLEDLGPTSAR
jgi:hypothetical protein